MNGLIVQLIGWAGMAAFLLSYQIRSNRTLFLLQAAGAALFCLQFLLMGAYSGCFSLVLIMIRGLMLRSYKTSKVCRWFGWAFVFTAGFTAVLVITWAGPLSLLAYAASVVSTFAYWTNNAGKIRAANLCVASPCWIVYDLIVGSWGGMASEAFTMISILVSIRRFGWKNLADKESEFQD